MATFLETWNLLSDTELQVRIAVALSKAAYGVLGEDPGTPNHALRLKWAQAVLVEATSEARIATLGFLGDNALETGGKGVSDEDLLAVAGKLIDVLSNRYTVSA